MIVLNWLKIVMLTTSYIKMYKILHIPSGTYLTHSEAYQELSENEESKEFLFNSLEQAEAVQYRLTTKDYSHLRRTNPDIAFGNCSLNEFELIEFH